MLSLIFLYPLNPVVVSLFFKTFFISYIHILFLDFDYLMKGAGFETWQNLPFVLQMFLLIFYLNILR